MPAAMLCKKPLSEISLDIGYKRIILYLPLTMEVHKPSHLLSFFLIALFGIARFLGHYFFSIMNSTALDLFSMGYSFQSCNWSSLRFSHSKKIGN